VSVPACPACRQPREARQLYCLKCRRPFGDLTDAPPLQPAPIGLSGMLRIMAPWLLPALFLGSFFLLVLFVMVKERGLLVVLGQSWLLIGLLVLFLPLVLKSRLIGDLRAGSQRVTVRFLRKNTQITRKQSGGIHVDSEYDFEWVGKLRAVRPPPDRLEEGAEYEIIFLPRLGLLWEASKVMPAVWVREGRSSAGRAAGASVKLWVDGEPLRHNPAPADIAAALERFSTTLRLDTESQLGRLSLSRLGGSLLRLTHYGGVSISTAGPLTPEQAGRALELAAGGAPDWDHEIAWDAAAPPTLRDQALVLLQKALIMAAVLTPVWLIVGIIIGANGLRHSLYDNPRCAAYAAAHGLTFIRYDSNGSSASLCLMAEGAVKVAVINAAAPPPWWGRLLFERHLYEALIIPAVVIALVVLLFKLLVRVARRREARLAARRKPLS
jgi:hypothetical protein